MMTTFNTGIWNLDRQGCCPLALCLLPLELAVYKYKRGTGNVMSGGLFVGFWFCFLFFFPLPLSWYYLVKLIKSWDHKTEVFSRSDVH